MRYRLLGKSGLRVSEVALGAMTFGEDETWGALGTGEAESCRVFDAFLAAGGNFVDTANNYMGGRSEALLGKFLQGQRDRVVLATKYTAARPSSSPGDPNAAGNHRKNLVASVDASLQRLGTDYLDLLYVHVWDFLTPVEEVMRALDDLVRAGKVLYTGVSNAPAWLVARANTLAELRDWSPFIVTQLEYNLLERTAERELLPMAAALDLGVTAWSPLASGLLTGKYAAAPDAKTSRGRLDLPGLPRPVLPYKDGANVARVVRELAAVAAELEASAAQVALAWLRGRGVIPIIGARTLAQLEHNLECLTVQLGAAQLSRLEAVSRIALGFPYDYYALPQASEVVYGGTLSQIDSHRPKDLPETLRARAGVESD